MATPMTSPTLVSQLTEPPPAAVPSNLPTPVSSLLGREQDVASVSALFRHKDVRLVSLTGPGGVGKTRLALGISANLAAAFPHGVWFVPLAPLSDTNLVLPAIARALRWRDLGDQAIADALAAALRHHQTLLVLDNMEHLLAAVPAIVALLDACIGVKALVTTRERLRISGEHEFPVLPLPVPARAHPATAAEVARSAPIQLFVERAIAVAPAFELTDDNAPAVTEICRRLDGLPLAIELAAARCNVLPPAAMLARLEPRLPMLIGGMRDTPARLRTMRDAIAWSHDLLTPDEQTLFRSLAVFTGGCSLEAAETIARAQGSDPSATPAGGATVLDLVTSLVDKSLLRPVLPSPRFVMLETVREFALERLAASSDEERAHRRHAAWCLTIAETVEAEALAGGWASSLDQMEPEYDNLRAALGWATRRRGEAAEIGLRLAYALWLFWVQRGHADEGRRWFISALVNAADETSALAGKAKLGLGGLANACGDPAAAMAVGQECLALYQALDDHLGVARAYHLLGTTALGQGDAAQAAGYLERAVAGYAAEGGERLWLALATAEQGVAAYCLGQPEPAAVLLERAAVLRDEFGATWPAMFQLPTMEQLAARIEHSSVKRIDAAGGPAASLSPREREILRLIATGQTNQQIAHTLCISPRTVSTHAANILAKLELSSRGAVISFAHRHGLA